MVLTQAFYIFLLVLPFFCHGLPQSVSESFIQGINLSIVKHFDTG